ncbi:MAG TPA: hypothetical protein VIN40_10230 [Candidatus Tyrphobacter sp.]
MRRPRHAVLGVALAETAIVLSFTLLVIFGAMQIALIGFYQTQLDGSTFMYSHSYANGSTNNAALSSALGPIFPNMPALTEAAANPLSTDTTTMPNFTQWGTLTQRFGGAATIRNQLIQTHASMTVNGLSVLGSSITLSAGNVEGAAMVGNHDDDAQGAGYNSQTVYNTLVNPLTQDDQNVPPYYLTFAYMSYCTTFTFGSSCSSWNTGGGLRSLGLAEYLKDDQTGNAGNYTSSADGIGTGGEFQNMACHQRIFSDLAAAFPAVMPKPSPAAGSDWDETSGGPATVSAFNGASFRMVYSWDVQGTHGESPGNKSFANGFPLNPGYGCSAGGPGA